MIKLRGVLNSSDDVLVASFNEMISAMDKSLNEQRTHLNFHVIFQPFHFRDEKFQELLTETISSFFQSMIWPAAKLCPIHKIRMTWTIKSRETFSKSCFRIYGAPDICCLFFRDQNGALKLSLNRIGIPGVSYCSYCDPYHYIRDNSNNGLFCWKCKI